MEEQTYDSDLELATKLSIELMNERENDQMLIDQTKSQTFPPNLYKTPMVSSEGNCWPETISICVATEQDITAQELRNAILPILRKNENDRYSNKFGAKRLVTHKGITYFEDYDDHVVGITYSSI